MVQTQISKTCSIAKNINFKYEYKNPRPHLLVEACYRPHPAETKNIPTNRHPDVEARNRTKNRGRDFEETNREVEDEKEPLSEAGSDMLIQIPSTLIINKKSSRNRPSLLGGYDEFDEPFFR